MENIEILKGKTIRKILGGIDSSELIFEISDDESYKMYHRQDCCETVEIVDICGDLEWLIDSPILLAEERNNENEEGRMSEHDESYTWTFYELATIKGSVTIRWYGKSNGYYSERVDFERIER